MNSTTLFRVRVQTTPPLEPLKAWHTIAPDSDTKYIRDLTRDIVLALGLGGTGEFSLELDGFALLPSSTIGVVRDGDTLSIKQQPHIEKRKAREAAASTSQSGSQSRKKQKTGSPSPQPLVVPTVKPSKPSLRELTVPGTLIPSPIKMLSRPLDSESSSTSSDSGDTSDSESSSDEDSSSGSDNSESESDSDSNSDSASSSSSDGPPQPRPILRKPNMLPKVPIPKPPISSLIRPKPINPLHPSIPPGHGKQSTKDRNVRRRKLQKYRAAGMVTVGPRVQSPTPAPTNATSLPVPQDANLVTTQAKPTAPVAPAKHANKNKRRGFDQDMASRVATRTVFDASRVSATPGSEVSSTPAPVAPGPASSKAAEARSRYTHHHVVPPSQFANLPSNVIVTSVDVEA
ncbi:hypothetical protein FRC06_010795, partial [Ceratobasidium sp. 370]